MVVVGAIVSITMAALNPRDPAAPGAQGWFVDQDHPRESRIDKEVEKHVHESPFSMTIPLMALAALSILVPELGSGHAAEADVGMPPLCWSVICSRLRGDRPARAIGQILSSDRPRRPA